jgi:photosystem II stability/assembly factor-like uncharacterized protein
VIKNNYGFLYSSVVIANGQGFDNCKPLSVEGMQDWWDNSPYSAVNIYLGGISALCPFDQLGIDWFSQVAKQGWTFILTWAGPQAPKGCPQNCKFRYPMSTEPEIAYLEGKLEALYAVEAAQDLGFKGQLVIYYDVESYSGADEETRETVAAFIQGWTEELHDQGHIAGAYGAACTSYVVDWAFNNPPLDEVWIAKWNKEYVYDPNATVYNTTCVDEEGQPPIFWTNHQRLKQYTGPHFETWGDLSVQIDSNVLDGKVNALFGHPPEKNFQPGSGGQVSAQTAITAAPHLHDMQLLSPSTGWVWRDDRLLLTADGGSTWQDISPYQAEQGEILGVHFLDPEQGWLVGRQVNMDGGLYLSVLQTFDSGSSWLEISVPDFTSADILEMENASFTFLDEQTAWLVFTLQSSSNFSFGRLLATRDGGLTWQERELPVGEPVVFQDEFNGWIAGGPHDQVYSTEDGGKSWKIATEQLEDEVRNLLFAQQQVWAGELPENVVVFEQVKGRTAWAIVQDGICTGDKLRPGEANQPGDKPLECNLSSRLLKSTDGGDSWSEITPRD